MAGWLTSGYNMMGCFMQDKYQTIPFKNFHVVRLNKRKESGVMRVKNQHDRIESISLRATLTLLVLDLNSWRRHGDRKGMNTWERAWDESSCYLKEIIILFSQDHKI